MTIVKKVFMGNDKKNLSMVKKTDMIDIIFFITKGDKI